MAWTKSDIEKLKLKHNLQDVKPKTDVLKKKHVIKGKISVEKEAIKTLLWVYKNQNLITDFCEELRFHHKRKFKFDWAIQDLKIAIEYEGLMSNKSGHTTVTGYTSDCEKYNLAQIEGWTVLRYTALNYKNLDNDLRKMLNLNNK